MASSSDSVLTPVPIHSASFRFVPASSSAGSFACANDRPRPPRLGPAAGSRNRAPGCSRPCPDLSSGSLTAPNQRFCWRLCATGQDQQTQYNHQANEDDQAVVGLAPTGKYAVGRVQPFQRRLAARRLSLETRIEIIEHGIDDAHKPTPSNSANLRPTTANAVVAIHAQPVQPR